jgi:NTE family protein
MRLLPAVSYFAAMCFTQLGVFPCNLARRNSSYHCMRHCIVLVVLLLHGIIGQCQNYRNLVLEGGGIRGVAFAGAFEMLDSFHILPEIRQVAGTSAGAVQALMLALGYNSNEISDLSRNMRYSRLNDGGFMLLGGSIRLKRRYGYYRGNALNEMLGNLIAARTGNSDLTFQQLDSLTKTRNSFRHLFVVVTNLSTQEVLVLSSATYPDMKIKDAVTASAAIPFYFEPVVIDSRGKTYPPGTRGDSLYYLADGGLVANYPYFVFIHDTGATLGLVLERPEYAHALNRDGNPRVMFEIGNLVQYTEACYQIILNRQKWELPDSVLTEHTAAISTEYINPRLRKLRKKKIQQLMHNGRQGVRDFAQRRGLQHQLSH